MLSGSVVRGLRPAARDVSGRSNNNRHEGSDGGATTGGPGVWASGIGTATAVMLMYHADTESPAVDGATSSSTPRAGAAAAMESLRRNGLVSTWNDKYYGVELPDPVAAGRLLLSPGLLWAAVELDAAATKETPADYMARVRASTTAFFEKKEPDGMARVINHEGTLSALRMLGDGDGKGQFVLLTGPRSVGKSLMLAKVAEELSVRSRRVLYVDARKHGTDLTTGIVASIAKDDVFFNKMLSFMSATISSAVLEIAVEHKLTPSTTTSVKASFGGKGAAAGPAPSPSPSLALVLGGFFAACRADGEFPVIIIDEANIAFDAAVGDAAAKARVLGELQLFTRISKQQREASVVLATSEHGLPFRLRALGFNTDHIRKTIVAEEVPPAVMKRELMQSWGCGEHLATALLSLYGGHVLHASAAVRKLATSTAPALLEGLAALSSIIWCARCVPE